MTEIFLLRYNGFVRQTLFYNPLYSVQDIHEILHLLQQDSSTGKRDGLASLQILMQSNMNYLRYTVLTLLLKDISVLFDDLKILAPNYLPNEIPSFFIKPFFPHFLPT